VRSVAGFSDRVSLLEHGARIYSNPDVILRVEFPGRRGLPPGPLYWRGRSYDRFDGWTWSRTPTRPHSLIDSRNWPAGRVEQLIYQTPIGAANVLFGLSPFLHAHPRSRIVAYAEPNGDFTYGGPGSPVYAAFSAAGEPAPWQLRRALPFRDPLAASYNRLAAIEQASVRPYLRLPLLSDRFQRLADSLAGPHANDYDRALAVRDFLSRFRYTLELPATEREASLEHFLFERRAGHCEYFSTAMALLLRAAGVPTRNVNGFLGGEWNGFGDFLTVTQNQAHSWVEVWFAGYGWVRFDPTPAAAADIAGLPAGAPWLTPLRHLFAGLEHRWGKWVLDYDLDDQSRLLARLSGRSRQPDSAPHGEVPWRVLVAGLLTLLLISRFRGRRRGRHPHPVRRGNATVVREYLRLRRAYARAGYDATMPPLTFLEQLRRAHAPALADASEAIRLYARLRFGPPGGGTLERRQLRQHVSAARRQLWRERRAGSRPPPTAASVQPR
jgi:transglutaminase-like putative cysteine protease